MAFKMVDFPHPEWPMIEMISPLLIDRLIIIMINNLLFFRAFFSRSRLRRGPKIDPKLKDYTKMHKIQKQIKQYR